jgi:thiol:disulfide interchange protein DsbD
MCFRERLGTGALIRGAVVVVAALLLGSAGASAQDSPVSWSASATAQGDTATFALSARLAAGWHLYSPTQGPGGPTPLRVNALAPARSVGALDAPVPKLAPDKSFGIITETYDDAVTFRGRAVSSSHDALALRVRYQTCDDRVCLPPTTIDVPVALSRIAAAPTASRRTAHPATRAAVAATTEHDTPREPSSTVARELPNAPPPAPLAATPVSVPVTPPALLALGPGVALDGPWAPFLWLAVTTALLALLTPCVFPMIPITVAYFTREGRTRGSALREALAYAAGIVAAFVVLGSTVVALFGAAGLNRLAANPWLNLALGLAFVVFALSLFGVVVLRVPGGVVNRIADSASSPRRSTVTTLATALTFTLTSFTCTAPFVGTLLVAATVGSWQRALAGITTFAVVFSLPFVALAAAPALLVRLPRSGAWMRTLKITLGVAELGAAVKFFANVDQVLGGAHLTRAVVLVVWAITSGALALYLLAPREGSTPSRRLLVALAPAALAIWLLLGASGRPLGELEAFVPPARDAAWITDDYPAALRAAAQSGRPVFVDFTGYTCTNCRWMEANMFPQPDVDRALGEFVLLRLYTDAQSADAERAQAMQRSMFHTVALPLYAVIGADGHPAATFLGMTRDRAEFVDFLRRAAASRPQ